MLAAVRSAVLGPDEGEQPKSASQIPADWRKILDETNFRCPEKSDPCDREIARCLRRSDCVKLFARYPKARAFQCSGETGEAI